MVKVSVCDINIKGNIWMENIDKKMEENIISFGYKICLLEDQVRNHLTIIINKKNLSMQSLMN